MTLEEAGSLAGDSVTIACDESGAEGENLMRAQHPVFVHASVNLTSNDAELFMDALAEATGSPANELKSSIVLRPRTRTRVLPVLYRLEGQANIHLVEKTYYVTAKLIALLVEEHAALYGEDLAASGWARRYAGQLHDLAPADLGASLWTELLTTYNDFIRVYARAGAKPPTTDAFYAALTQARAIATRGPVRAILDAIWEARHFAIEYEGPRADQMREMDPMFSSMSAVARTWRVRLGNVPIAFVADRYSTLTAEMRANIVQASGDDLAVANMAMPTALLQSIDLVDSRDDARVRAADIVGGIGREIARLAQHGTFDDELQVLASEMLDFSGMWSDTSYLDALYERRPPRYLRAFIEKVAK